MIDTTALADAIEWLNDGCPSAPQADQALTELCLRLTGCGVPLVHGAIFVRTLHPEIIGRRFIWHPKTGVDATSLGHEMFGDPEYRDSPIRYVFDNATPLRRRLGDPECPIDFSFLDKFRDEGVTDFLAMPLPASDGVINASAWMTLAEGGFSAAHLEALDRIRKPLARMVEVRALKRVAVNLLDTYVGGQAGARILGGRIRRGDIEAIRAAIWLSDMRGFTARSDRMPAAELVALLNQYFDCQVPVIRAHGGEVLKFMGDGLLAIFPIGDGAESAVCNAAFTAARQVEAAVAEADWGERERKGGVAFGVALHVGEVLYGNVGSANRLDFTCIGPAVNVAARIEKLSGEIGRTILASEAFARHCGGLKPVGTFALKGVAAEQRVYGIG